MIDGPAWARGFSLVDLQKRAQVFAKCHKPFVFGAFGLVKERDIAAAMAVGNFYEDGLDVLALAHKLQHGSTQHDFTGRAFAIGANTTLVSALAVVNVEKAVRFLKYLGDRVVVEIFEEDKLAKRAVKGCGYHYMATKVMAGSEIKGMYCSDQLQRGLFGTIETYSALPGYEEAALWATDHRATPSVVTAIRRELVKAGDMYAQHYSGYNKRQSWTAFALRGYDADDPGFIIKPAEMSRKWREENPERIAAKCAATPAWRQFPSVGRLLDDIPAPFERVRFMRLAAEGGELSRHADITDRDAGLADGKVARLHIPIATNKEVQFRSWNSHGVMETLHFEEGRIYYLDTRKPHQVVNPGKSERIHLVADAVSNQKFRDWLFKG